MKYDVVVVGAGIIGSLVADQLARYDLKIAVIEKNSDSGLEQSMSSSAIVHSGIDPKDGTLKAKYNVLGNRMMADICAELNVEYLQCGGFICAQNDDELKHLEQLVAIANKREIACQIISGDELRVLEPNVSLSIKYALSMPTTGVIYPTELTTACLERAITNGVKVIYDCQVVNITFDTNYRLETSLGIISADFVVNCAGIHSDELARMTDPNLMITNVPKRGEYFVTNNINPVVTSVIYPVPNANGKGVLAVPTTHGNVLLGPNGVIQTSKTDDGTHSSDLRYVQANVTKVLSKFPTDVIKTYAGLRSTGNDGDFYIERCHVTNQMINLIAIDSPGLASSPAIAKDVVEIVAEDLQANINEGFISERPRYISLKDYSLAEQNKMIDTNATFGKIICRCEQVSEGEIRAAIRKTNGARNLTGIKFRIRPMLGMCQGGFCETEVVRILADELGVPITQIRRSGKDSVIIKGGADE